MYPDDEDDQTADTFLGDDPIAYEDDSGLEANTTIRPGTLPLSWLAPPQPTQSFSGTWNDHTIVPLASPSWPLNDNQQSALSPRTSERPTAPTPQSDNDQMPLLTFRSGDGSTQIDPQELHRRLTQSTHRVS